MAAAELRSGKIDIQTGPDDGRVGHPVEIFNFNFNFFTNLTVFIKE